MQYTMLSLNKKNKTDESQTCLEIFIKYIYFLFWERAIPSPTQVLFIQCNQGFNETHLLNIVSLRISLFFLTLTNAGIR